MNTNNDNVKLSDAGRLARNEYRRKWQRENRDKCRAYVIKHWNKKAMENMGNPGQDEQTAKAEG